MHALKREKQRCDPGGVVTEKVAGNAPFPAISSSRFGSSQSERHSTTRSEPGFPCRRKGTGWGPGPLKAGGTEEQRYRRCPAEEGFAVVSFCTLKAEGCLRFYGHRVAGEIRLGSYVGGTGAEAD